MTVTPSFRIRLVLLILVAGPLLSLLFVQNVPQGNSLWGESLNAGHSVLFGIIAVMVLWTGKARTEFTGWSLVRQYAGVGGMVLGLGVLTELIQPFFHRDCELGDMVRDAVGIFAFLAILSMFNHRLDGDRRELPRRVRSVLVLMTVVGLVGVSTPAAIWGLAYLHRNQMFPVIASYDSWLSRKFLFTQNARLEAVDPPSGWGEGGPKTCVRVTLCSALYPGIRIEEPAGDWTGFDSLQFDVYSEQPSELRLALRIDDQKHNFTYGDRYNGELRIVTGRNRISVPLSEIERGPKKRRLDLGHVGRIMIFAGTPEDTVSFYLGPLQLIR
jgi:hypothetical protein